MIARGNDDRDDSDRDDSWGGRVAALDSCVVRDSDPDRVRAVRDRAPGAAEVSGLADLFRLLGDGTRVNLLYALAEGGELCVCDLAEAVGKPESNVSHALRLLRMAGVVRTRRDGRRVYYALDDVHVRLLLDVSREHLRHLDAPAQRARRAR